MTKLYFIIILLVIVLVFFGSYFISSFGSFTRTPLTNFNFYLSVYPVSGSAYQDSSITTRVGVSTRGASTDVGLSILNCPLYTTCILSPESGIPNFFSTLTIITTDKTPLGNSIITIKGEEMDKIKTTTYTLTVNPNVEHILNYLNYVYNSYLRNDDIVGLQWTIDTYDILDVTVPNRYETIQFFDSRQNSSGCWFEKTNHYVPKTAQILMVYNRSEVKPTKPLDPFFSTIDTWDEVKADVQTYDGGNPWGGLWGYIETYIVYKNQAPPWTNDFLDALNTNFDSWANYSHQRTHVVMNLYALNLAVPRVDDVVTRTLQDQKTDGSWQDNEAETVFNIGMLGMLRGQTTIDKALIDSAITKGKEYVKKCYKTTIANGKTYGFFTLSPTNINPDTRATSLGVLALINPTSDIWTRWFAPSML